MRRAVRAMSDAALLEKAKPLPWEDCLSRVGCGLSLAATAVVTVWLAWIIWTHLGPRADKNTWVALFGGLLPSMFTGLIFGGLVYAGFQVVVGLRPFRYRAELKRRYRPKMLRQAVEEAEESFTSSRPPDWAFVVSALEPRYQIRDLVWADLWEGPPPTGRIAVRHQVPMDFTLKNPLGLEVGEAILPSNDCERLLSAFQKVNLSAFRSIGLSEVKDVSPYEYGYRCRMALLQREPRRGVVIQCNLEGAPWVYAAQPTMALAGMLMELSRAVTRHPLTFGPTNPSDGNEKGAD